MTLITLPYRPTAGSAEDISQIIADFDAVLAVVNGGLKDDNVHAAAAVALSKLSAVGAADGQPIVYDGVTDNRWEPGKVHLDYLAQSGASTGQIPVWNGTKWAPASAVPVAKVSRSGAQAISANTDTAITWTSEVKDTDTIVDLGTQATRFTIKTAGFYCVHFVGSFEASATGFRVWGFKINGAAGFGWSTVDSIAGSGAVARKHAITFGDYAVNDYIECMVRTSTALDFTFAEATVFKIAA